MADDIAAVPLRRSTANLNPRRARVQPSSTGATALRAHRPYRFPEIVVGVLLVAGCALAAVLWNQSHNATNTIVVAARKDEDFGPIAQSQYWEVQEPDPKQWVWTDDYSNIIGSLIRKLKE